MGLRDKVESKRQAVIERKLPDGGPESPRYWTTQVMTAGDADRVCNAMWGRGYRLHTYAPSQYQGTALTVVLVFERRDGRGL